MAEDNEQKEVDDVDEIHEETREDSSLNLSPEDLQRIAVFVALIGADTR